MADAQTIRNGLAECQVCVPKTWTDEQIEEFANDDNPSGVQRWKIIREGDKRLLGDPERNQCLQHKSRVHVLLGC